MILMFESIPEDKRSALVNSHLGQVEQELQWLNSQIESFCQMLNIPSGEVLHFLNNLESLTQEQSVLKELVFKRHQKQQFIDGLVGDK